ncbi:NmrA family transcriptional regulator [Oceanicoccus sp. KOV_DT_Chl]|uniref:NmrA family transcriptional regulator n=1 Tax=Oceanicoccus sp. KOV_DT_Chl TaxID=1904639 RepID=UPI000C7C6B92|nr:NmrA family transcriptional regulator [Oceanicoccus sp. KOV_DT_Chl]
MKSQTTLIIGKHAKTGSRVEALLQKAGITTRAVSRSTEPAFDWQKPEEWPLVMQGCQSAYVTFQPDLAIPAAQGLIAEFIRQAKVAGIRHIVLLSGRGEEGAQRAEKLLINSGLHWNVVRASWFAQNFSEGFLVEGILQGQLALPAGEVPEPFVDADDIAEVAFACLTQPELANQLFEVTGPELLTFRDCAAIISQVIKRPVALKPITTEYFLEGLQAQGLPAEMLWLMNELFDVVMDGRNSYISQDVDKALGRPATSFQQYVAKTEATGVWTLTDDSPGILKEAS